MNDAKDVTPLLELANLPSPPLCVMSLSLRTVMNPKEKSNEVVAVAVTVFHEGKKAENSGGRPPRCSRTRKKA